MLTTKILTWKQTIEIHIRSIQDPNHSIIISGTAMIPTLHISSTHTIYIPTFSTTANPTKQIELGWKLKQYMKNHFSPTPDRDRPVTLMQRAVFEMLTMLRNQNLKEGPIDPPSEIVDEATCLDFKWLHPLEFRKTRASCFLRVENNSSKERGYLLDHEQYQLFMPDWDAAIDSDSNGFKTFVLVYNPNKSNIYLPELSKNDNSHQFVFLKERTEDFSIPKYQKEDYNSFYFVKPQSQDQPGLNPKSTDDTTLIGLSRDIELKYFMMTRTDMTSSLYRYVDSLVLAVNDMAKFVGFNEPISFQGNYKTNHTKLCIRNTDRITYHILKTRATDINYGGYKGQAELDAERLLYTTKADYGNMLVFINFCEKGYMKIYQGQQVDHDARLKMLEVIDLSTHQTARKSREKIRQMDLSQFVYLEVHTHSINGQFQIESQTAEQFIERCNEDTSYQRQCIESIMRKYENIIAMHKRKVRMTEGVNWCSYEYTYMRNGMQYLILAEIWRRVSGEGHEEREQKKI